MLRKVMLLLVILLVTVPFVAAQDDAPEETPVTFIELAGPAAERDAEISSLAWYGDTLLLMTENPFIYRERDNVGMFFALDKEDILDYLAAENPEPLTPRPVPLYGRDIVDAVGGYAVAFDGFESAAFVTGLGYFVDDMIYLTIEADTVNPDDPTMRGYVVSGRVRTDSRGNLRGIDLNMDRFIEIPRQTDFNNMSYESMFVADGKLVVIYEANGVNVNAEPVAYTVDLQTGELATVPFPNVEYRITDVTMPDENGVFWAINYFFVGEDFLANDEDPIFATYGMGASQAEFDGFERLVSFQFTGDAIELVDAAPIQLLMTEESRGRNWEGIARLDDMGFLVVTDKWPQTILGFVPAE